MARWLYIWELGGGFGHLQRMASISRALEQAGEKVSWCVPQQHLDTARGIWPKVTANPNQARLRRKVKEPGNFAELLQNEGWHDIERLSCVVEKWQETFLSSEAERLILDFAPDALLAALASDREVDVAGTGFYIPPATDPLPAFREDRGVYSDRLLWAEQQACSVVSRVLDGPVESLSDVFHHAWVRNHLLTTPEWDHYGARTDVDYCGLVTGSSGQLAAWPTQDERRIFAYLRPFANLSFLLQAMHRVQASVLVHGSTSVGETVKKMGLRGITFYESPVDERSVGQADAVMVNHAGHDGTLKAVQAGIALWQLPLTIEQALTAQHALELGVSDWTDSHLPEDFQSGLERLLEEQPSRHERAIAWANAQQAEASNLQRLVSRLLD